MNITGIVGVAEDTDGALMLTTSDPAATREAFAGLGLAYEEHDPDRRPRAGAVSRSPTCDRGGVGRLTGDADAAGPPGRTPSPFVSELDDVPTAIPALLDRIGAAGGTLRTLSTVRRIEPAEPDARPASSSRSRSRA